MSTIPNPILCLDSLKSSHLPPSDASRNTLLPLLTALLHEAITLVDPTSGEGPTQWKQKGTKSYPTSTANVVLTQKTLNTGDTWISRCSTHEDAAIPGTASWDEFYTTFKEKHVESEAAFMPTVVSAETLTSWDCTDVHIQPPSQISTSTSSPAHTYTNITLCTASIRHAIARPLLRDRTFPILQMTCSASTGHEFLVITATINDLPLPLGTPKDVIVADYISVERIRKRENDNRIEWIMATASDARGVLPMWVQTRAVPGQIAQDVPHFFGWMDEKRKLTG